MPFYICPNCKQRSIDHDGKQGLLQQAVACERCGFGFLFELMEDYFPAPTAGLVVCDAEGRVLAVGRGIFELTGYRDSDLIGRNLVEALGISGFADGRNPVSTALEWGVRQLNQDLALRSRTGLAKRVKADFFPAYDEDGGLLVSLTPARPAERA